MVAFPFLVMVVAFVLVPYLALVAVIRILLLVLLMASWTCH